MNNLFEGAKFGDKYRMRQIDETYPNGRMALFASYEQEGEQETVHLFIEGDTQNSHRYMYDGTLRDCGNRKLDIVSRW